MKQIVNALFMIFIVSAMSLSCKNSTTPTKPYWEIEDSIKKAEEDSVTRVLKQKRQRVEPKENKNDTIWGGVVIGQTRKEYDKALAGIEKSVGYKSISFGDITLYPQNAKFHKGKLYSLEFEHTYYYRPHRANYNSTPYFNPMPYIKPIITHFEEKYGLSDFKDEYTHDIRGREKAVDFKEVWIFSNKRITISNEAEQYSNDPQCASYILKIIIDSPQIANEIEEAENKERKIKEEKAKQAEEERQKKEKELLNTL